MTTDPRKSDRRMVPPPSRVGRLKCGARLPMSGDEIALGSRVSPKPRSKERPATMTDTAATQSHRVRAPARPPSSLSATEVGGSLVWSPEAVG
jgi:hypothetical protein